MSTRLSSGRWQRIKALFHTALEGTRSGRAAVLSGLREEPSLREELEALIAAYESGSGFLRDPATRRTWTAGGRGGDLAEFEGNERFEVRRRLGAGGFGVVHEAMDRERGIVVAIKTLHRADAAALYRFKREFRSLADVQHPNLVQLYDLLSDGQRWFLTMERVHGLDFLAHVGLEAAAEPEAAWERLRRALRQLAEGIQALHEAGKLHGDIKSSNVLVTREGRVVLLDFGLVSDLGQDPSRAPQIAGTPAYMPPEVVRGEPAAEAGDWYSVGVILYEALCGRLPFTGSSAEILAAKRQRDPAPPSVWRSGLPADLEALTMELLAREPLRRPDGPAILRRLAPSGSEVPAAAAVRDTASVLIGREAHLARLHEAFRATQGGTLVTMHVRGSSGVGKTALVRGFLDELRHLENRLVVLSGRCYEHESVPYKALDGVIDSLSLFMRRLPRAEAEGLLPRDVRALARLFPVLRQVESVEEAARAEPDIPDPQESRRRALNALKGLLGRLAEQRPLVLCADDLQWGDAETAGLLADLQRAGDAPAMFVIAAYRREDAEKSPFLGRLLAASAHPLRVRHLELEDLALDEAATMVSALLGTAAPALAQSIARESRGNPFFVGELVRHWRSFQGAPGRVEAREPPGSLDLIIRARVARLPEPVRRLLEVVCVAGHPMGLDAARQAAGIERDDPAAVITLRNGHLARTLRTDARDEVEPYHDRIREAVAADLSPHALQAHHGAVARALEASTDADPEALALHFRSAGEPAKAGGYALLAAERAAETLAFARAARLYRMVLELTSPEDPGRGRLHHRLGEALANGGFSAEAAVAFLEAAVTASPDAVIDLQRRAAELLLFSGHLEQGVELIGTVLTSLGIRSPRTHLGTLAFLVWRRVLVAARGLRHRERAGRDIPPADLSRIDAYWSMSLALPQANPLRGADFQVRHLLAALRAGEPRRVARALCGEIMYSAVAGNRGRARALRLLSVARPKVASLGDPYLSSLILCGEGLIAQQGGQWKRALALIDAGRTVLRDQCTGVAWELDNWHLFFLYCLLYLGRLKDLAQGILGVLREAHDRGDIYLSTRPRVRLLALIHLAHDDPAAARRELASAMKPWANSPFSLHHLNEIWGRVETSLYAGEPEEAWGYVDLRWKPLRRSHLLRMQLVRISTLEVRARAAVAAASLRHNPARRALLRRAGTDARRLEREGVAWGGAHARLLSAGVASVQRRLDQALDLLASAEREYEAVEMPLYAAAARRRRGEVLGGDTGRDLVQSADAWMANEGVVNPARMTAMLAPGRFDA